MKNRFNKLLAAVKRGESGSLEEFYRHYYGKTVIIAQSVVKDWEAAKDIASDFVVELMKAGKEIECVENGDSYVYSRVKDKAKEYVQEREREAEIREPTAAAREIAVREKLMIAVESLDKRERATFELRYVLRMRYREIAEELGITAREVKKRISDLKRRLRALLLP